MISPKDLKKLADMCRKAGVKHFKQGDVEFTLTDEAPVSNYKRKANTEQKQQYNYPETPFETDSLTEEQLLFYSVQDIVGDGSGVGEDAK